jgi:hypothetical protein
MSTQTHGKNITLEKIWKKTKKRQKISIDCFEYVLMRKFVNQFAWEKFEHDYKFSHTH